MKKIDQEDERKNRFRLQGYTDFSSLKSPRWAGHRYLPEYMEGWNAARKEFKPTRW